ncbi:hypothetical protein V8E51_011212 [Hyaloscypha variabilis]|uniref:Fungal calcium binding protein domain-containing protein n=1 Tax=Hyaloscypha variabilis (strain UAMH 11265 / GT02V1 / F) TaxID=1149755 RepID=A0A2J6RXH7_HYAVF|nr:hypothetical protein L207DRAFT_580084 [Hyaloscypha variabilis F]
MRFSLGLIVVFVSGAFTAAIASPPTVCDVDSDACRAVMDATACFNEIGAASGAKASMLACLTGTDGTETPTQKMCGGVCCVAPVLATWIGKNLACSS